MQAMQITPAAEQRVSLFDIGDAIAELERQIEAAEELGQEDLSAMLFGLLEDVEGQLADKAARILALMDDLEARQQARKEYVKRFEGLNKQDKRKVDSLRNLLRYGMERVGIRELRTVLGNCFIAKPKRKLVEIDAYAAALAGFGEVEVVAKTTGLDGIRELGALMMNLAASGTPVTVTATVRLGPYDAERLKETLTSSAVCSSRPVADEAAILEAAERDAAALAEHEQQVVAALAAGEEPPDRPEPTLPPDVARTEMVRTLTIRRS